MYGVFADSETFAPEMPRGPGLEQFNKIMDAQFIIKMDVAHQARVHRLLMPTFSSWWIARLKDSIIGIVHGVLDRIEANGPAFPSLGAWSDRVQGCTRWRARRFLLRRDMR